MADKNPINWSGIGSAVSAGAGAIGSLFGLFTQNKANKDNMRFQRQENERNRNFQREMADYAYQKNLEQWNRENEYNSPIETRKRLKNAGLNPDLFYGGGAGNMVSADSPMMSAPSGTGGVSPAVRPVSADTHALDLEMRRAQIDNINADTDEKKQEALNTSIQAETNKLLQDGIVQLQDFEVKISEQLLRSQKADADFKESAVSDNLMLLKKNIEKVTQDIATGKAQEGMFTSQAALNNIDRKFKEYTFALRLRQIALQNEKSIAEMRAMATQATAAMMCAGAAVKNANAFEALVNAQKPYYEALTNNENWKSHINKATLANIKIEGARMLFDFEQEQDWNTFQRSLNALTQIVGVSADAYTSIRGGVNLHLSEMTSTSGKDPITGNKWTHSWYNYGK